MIVSEVEIHKVIDMLTHGAPVADLGRSTHCPMGQAAAAALGAICTGTGRRSRLDDLRSMLMHGEYVVAPTTVADKMVGRAICDQVARLYDV